MIYVFEDGRTLYGEKFLTKADENKYVAVDTLPQIPQVEGKVGYLVGNLDTGKIDIKYVDYEEPEELEETSKPNEPAVPEPTDEEIIQAEILLNLQDVIINQQNQDETLAAILLTQAGQIIESC